MTKFRWFILGLFVISCISVAEENLLPNGSFEQGDDIPAGWKLAGSGKWQPARQQTGKLIQVSGNGLDSSYWYCQAAKLQTGKCYRICFKARGTGSGGGIISGPSIINRDFHPSQNWQEYCYVFTPTHDIDQAVIRLGQWHWKGTIWFDDARITEVMPVHYRQGGVTLAAGENIRDGNYSFKPNFAYEGSNYSRCLYDATAGFNSNRWTFAPGKYLIYKHRLPRCKQTQARVEINIGYYLAGKCLVQCSRDGNTWQTIGQLTGLGTKEFTVPKDMFPAESVYIKLLCPNLRQDPGKNPASFQVHTYSYTAKLDKPLTDIRGFTRFLEVRSLNPRLQVNITSLSSLLPGEENNQVVFVLGNQSPNDINLSGTIKTRSTEGELHTVSAFREFIPRGKSIECSHAYQLRDAGKFDLIIQLNTDSKPAFFARAKFSVPSLYKSSYGYWGGNVSGLNWWWCESTYKISRSRPLPPQGTGKDVMIYAARGEYEPVQIVLRPQRDMTQVKISLVDVDGTWHKAVRLYYEWYHYVNRPTDASGCVGWWPDALPEITGPLSLKAGQNQPLWILVKVPLNADSGEHTFSLQIQQADIGTFKIPIRVHVYDFSIPRVNHIETAFGLSAGNIKRYHNLKNQQQERQVWDLYMQNFREHRISPYDFAPFDPIKLKFAGPAENMKAVLDFSRWDKQARKYLDDYGFTSFRLKLRGMGGGTFHSRHSGKIGPYKQGSPAYRRLFKDYCMQLQQHLETNGWLQKAYVYWFDEPAPRDYDFVRAGMAEIKRAGPKLRRMLTEEPNPALFGSTDIWCPVLYNYHARSCQSRQKLGERIWWYVCTGPKAPYPGLFIDHNAIDLRIWLWMTWKWQVQGILVWQSNYWTSPAAFPAPKLQNPWEDPMGYVSGYGRPPGFIGYWGNGDGRFIYPPNRDIMQDKKTYLAPPVSSIRWEMLRDGLEDYEYFWLLQNAIKRATKRGVSPAVIDTARQLLVIPQNIIRDKTHFTRDPQPLYQRRRQVAKAIETLNAQY